MWRRYNIWIDVVGNTRLISNNYSSAPFGNLDAYISSVSNATVLQSSQGTVTAPGGTPVAATYATVWYAAYCTVADAAGLESIIIIPAPQLTIFASDSITVLPSVLSALLAAALADGYVLPGGSTPTAVLAGIMRQTGKQR